MRLSAVAFFMILTTVFLSGCGQSTMATLDERGGNFYGHGGVAALTNSGAAQQAVPVMSVSSNDLMAPGASASSQSIVSSAPQAVAGCNHGSPFMHAGAKSPVACNTPTGANVATAQAAQATSGWQWPVNGKVTEKFGQQADGIRNEGIVIAAKAGTPIRAADAGQVAYVGNDTKNYGNIVILRHADGEMTSYAHAQSIIVKQGDHVPSGATLGYVGQTGNAKAPELHFAVRDGKNSIDPLTKLPQQPQQMASN